MSPEKAPQLSEEDRLRARDVAKRMLDGDSYLKAVRQILTNKRITHEPDVQRIMKELAPHVDRQKELILDEQEISETINAESKIKETDRQTQEFQDVADERGGDPED